MRHIFKLASAAVFLSNSAMAQSFPNGDVPPCEGNAQYRALDISIPTHKIKLQDGRAALDVLKDDFGIRTVIRYYDYYPENESIKGKTLTAPELAEIFKRSLSVAVVFQHNNNDPATFINGNRGTQDAERAWKLAQELGQPYGTAIYFGVDGVDDQLENMVSEYKVSGDQPMTDERKNDLMTRENNPLSAGDVAQRDRFYTEFLDYHKSAFNKPVSQLKAEDMLPHIERYFNEVKAVFDKHSGANPAKSYTIGVYGSGLTNLAMEKKPFVKHLWLAQSGAWPKYDDFKATGRWTLLQKRATGCPWPKPEGKGNIDFDFNVVGPNSPNFGQWSRSTVVPAPAPPR